MTCGSKLAMWSTEVTIVSSTIYIYCTEISWMYMCGFHLFFWVAEFSTMIMNLLSLGFYWETCCFVLFHLFIFCFQVLLITTLVLCLLLMSFGVDKCSSYGLQLIWNQSHKYIWRVKNSLFKNYVGFSYLSLIYSDLKDLITW